MSKREAASGPCLVPCVHCGVLTPVEVICSRPAPKRTLCPEHRRTANELLAAHVEAFVANCRAKTDAAPRKAAA